MSEVPIIELPDRQGIGVIAGQVILRQHSCRRYLWPFGTGETFPADFGCPQCGVPVRWAMTEKHSTIFSCHCLIAVCGAPKAGFFIDNHVWARWIFDYWNQEHEKQQSQAN